MPNDTEILIRQITDLGIQITQKGDVSQVITKPTEFLKWLESIKKSLAEKDKQDSLSLDVELGSKDKNRELESLKSELKHKDNRIYQLNAENIEFQNQCFWLKNEVNYWRMKYFEQSHEPNYTFQVRGPVHLSNYLQAFKESNLKSKSTKQFDL